MSDEREQLPEIALRMHDPRVADARGRLLGDQNIAAEDLEGTIRVMNALFLWREAERRVSEASRRFMRLGESDMKALRYAIIMADQGRHVTARDLAEHLSISSASVTKLL
ncbi:MAG TPA: MarR family transcriptional regulator, partial [Microbacteriaceae bacterium]|nr:MarR family transcriptional regulator [Microbacteriaceae bacterium]